MERKDFLAPSTGGDLGGFVTGSGQRVLLAHGGPGLGFGHLSTLVDATGIVPAVNQIELHPLLPQQELRELHATLGIATEAWSPLGQGSLLENATVVAIAEARRKTPAQVLIRWHVQLGNIVIPKSVNPDRIASNFDVFDFELDESDMASIASLEDGTRLGPDPRTFNFTG